MIVTVRPGADPEGVRRALTAQGLWVARFEGTDGRTAFVVKASSGEAGDAALLAIDGVESVSRPRSAHPLVDAQPAAVNVGPLTLGRGAAPVMMAGPCSVESEEQIHATAARLARAGAGVLRGGAFKPRSSPYEFQGHGLPALSWLSAAARAHGLRVVSEALSEVTVDAVAEVADLVQVGSRNMHNTALLRAIGRTRRPVLLKRGMSATVDEWLLAGEYLLVNGASAVVFCERGIRSFDDSTRNLLDLGAVALLAHVYHQPVMVDPSHALGRRDLIEPLSRAALAAGAAGLLLEVHDDPGCALSDGAQALSAAEFAALVARLPGSSAVPSSSWLAARDPGAENPVRGAR